MRKLLLTTILALGAGPMAADEAALVLGISRYDALERVLQGDAVAAGAVGLSRQGVRVASGLNTDVAEMRALATSFLDDRSGIDGQVVVLSGRFATDGRRSWYLARDSRDPSLFDVGGAGLSVETVLRLLADTPGKAVLVLGYDERATRPLDTNLREGIGELDVPSGVTVVMGDPGSVAALLADTLAQPGSDVMRAVRENRRISALGFLPQQLILIPPERQAATSARPDPAIADQAAWQAAANADTLISLNGYLQAFPTGLFVDQARARITAITAEPNRADRLAEEALNLSRDARRAVQRDLTVLNFDPRGIDGIFGPGTRNAVKNWQQQNGFAQTSYLTAEQITRLDAQAARRAQELEAAAARQRAAEEARDRAYWEETGAKRDEAGLRAYLARYPDGTYSDQAARALAELEAANRQRAETEDRAAWDRARERNTQNSYRSYLESNPRGAFRDAANARIEGLQQDNTAAPARQAAQAGEAALGLDPLTLRLIEARLAQLDLNPGEVDGTVDVKTRRAIRRYQRDRELTVSGFLNEETVARLLRDGFP